MSRWTMNHEPRVHMDMSEAAENKRKAIAAKRYANWFAKLSPGEQRGIVEARANHAKMVAAGTHDARGQQIAER